MTTPNIYLPDYTKDLGDRKEIGQIRVGIQALQGLGKTWAALTFPNPLVLDFDNNLAAHRGKAGIKTIDFWDDKFINGVLQTHNNIFKHFIDTTRRPNRRDALKDFLHKYGSNFTEEQTIILDSWTTVQNNFDIQQNYEPAYTKSGDIDGFAFWEAKKDYSIEIVELLKSFRSNIVVTVHEMFERDKDDRIVGIGPLMQGKAFKDQFSSHFTDWFRLRFLVFESNDVTKKLNPAEKDLVMSPEFCDKVISRSKDGAWVFQVYKDELALSVKTSLKNIPAGVKHIPAHYKIFELFK